MNCGMVVVLMQYLLHLPSISLNIFPVSVGVLVFVLID